MSGQSQWQIHATREMVPQLDAMTATTRALEAVATKHGGDYDGWGTGVVK
jgi:regulator of RNase E activity RraB